MLGRRCAWGRRWCTGGRSRGGGGLLRRRLGEGAAAGRCPRSLLRIVRGRVLVRVREGPFARFPQVCAMDSKCAIARGVMRCWGRILALGFWGEWGDFAGV